MHHIKVAIIHNNTLISLGIFKILDEMFNIKPQCYKDLISNDLIDNFELIFVSDVIYAHNIDLFISKRYKCVLISSTNYNEHSISEYDSEENIISKISKNITLINDRNKAQSDLSKREIEVLRLIVGGCINKEIAETLNISINTVLTHRKNITSKLGIKSVSGLSVYAMMNGLV